MLPEGMLKAIHNKEVSIDDYCDGYDDGYYGRKNKKKSEAYENGYYAGKKEHAA